MGKSTKKNASKKNETPVVEVNAIEKLKEVAASQKPVEPGKMTKEQRDEAVAKLLHALYNEEGLTSKDKKTIRRTLRDTYDYYISRERKNAGNAVVSRILQEQGAA